VSKTLRPLQGPLLALNALILGRNARKGYFGKTAQRLTGGGRKASAPAKTPPAKTPPAKTPPARKPRAKRGKGTGTLDAVYGIAGILGNVL
jgi:hypothetical protein